MVIIVMFLLVILSFVEFHVGVSSNSIFIVAWIVEVMRKVCQVVSEGHGEILEISLKNCLETDVLCRDFLISNAPLQHYFELLEQLKYNSILTLVLMADTKVLTPSRTSNQLISSAKSLALLPENIFP